MGAATISWSQALEGGCLNAGELPETKLTTVLLFLADKVAADEVAADEATAATVVVVDVVVAKAMAKVMVAVETADSAHQALRELTTTTT